MKCLLCESFSFNLICKKCIESIIFEPHTRDVKGLMVYSFYSYSTIELLLQSKYSIIGSRIYKILAKRAVEYFKQNISSDFSGVYGIGLDDRIDSSYSHTGIIVNEFKSIFTPIFGVLKASNNIHYAGKSLEYRENNKKGFIYYGHSGLECVIFDDIITSGCSIKEANEVLKQNGVKCLFALSLSDARF